MMSASGRSVIVFNGEIYNFKELKSQLPDYPFRTNSDTEVLLAAYETWGVSMLEKLRGMYAFAIWDDQTQELFIAGDHCAMKPLYWFYDGATFAFGSELKALLACPFVSRDINSEAVQNYFSFYAINQPQTLFADIHALKPGHYLKLSQQGLEITRYWTPATITSYPQELSTVRQKTAALLENAVRLHMRADIPVGAFLSGGIDSATIVGLMSRFSEKPIETFSIGFESGSVINELPLAKLVAQKFGTNHHELIINDTVFGDALEDFLVAIDQPSGDGLNSFLVARATAQSVSVALSGLGGDELFLGYRYMQDLAQLWRTPKLVRNCAALLTKIPGFKSLAYKTNNNWVNFAESYDPAASYARARSLAGNAPADVAQAFAHDHDWSNGLSKAELLWYTPGTLLRDGDATAMASTLEVRFPFLDRDLIEYLLTAPSALKLGKNKPLLTSLFPDFLPEEILNFPKQGFEMPVGFWLKKACSQELLKLKKVQWLDQRMVEKELSRFFADPRYYLKIWSLFVLLRTLERYHGKAAYEKDIIYSSRQRDWGSRAQPTAPGSLAR